MAKSDIAIAREASMQPISGLAEGLGIESSCTEHYGRYKAKIDSDQMAHLAEKPDGKLILVTAISPTPAGEGKTTTTVGLGDGLNRTGRKTMIALREPSLGPCFGVKGGAAGGGYAQVVPMEDINLHFTGDFHAISSAHNLLAAMIDNHIYWGNSLALDTRRISWRRVVDMNDRALRQIVASLGGTSNGFPRESGFDITVASEIMAIFCLASSLDDLQERLGRIVIGQRRDRSLVTAAELKADGAMTVLLKDAFKPNLVQTLEHNPAFIHGGPFANIAHGCNSLKATKTALKLADYVVTEAGFGADLGAEKFFNIKCRIGKLAPDAVVLVATIRALKMHGGVAKDALGAENLGAVRAGGANLQRHLRNLKRFGVPAVVAINRFTIDTEAEVATVRELADAMGAKAVECTHWADGGAGTLQLAEEVAALVEGGGSQFSPLYDDQMPLFDKINIVAREIYGADEAIADKQIRDQLHSWEEQGFGHLPVCMAKTQYSFSTDPQLMGAPSNHSLPVREVRLAAGAGFIVVICGAIMTMPGLPRMPAAEQIHLDSAGHIQGLF